MPGGRIDIDVEPDLSRFPGKLASGLRGVTGLAGSLGKGLGIAVAAGTALAAVGLRDVIALGNEYTANLNELQAVSGATASEMRRIGQAAKDLGSDMTLPATSAADAAAAMVELAKGGLTVAEAMKAAKGTLQLAAAAQIDGATAAEIQSSSLNAFGLSADKAGRVADVLANTANAAAGSIIDIGNSLKYVAPVSAALKVSLEDTAAAIGLLANQGVKGEQAGTSLRGILASLSSPSAAAKKAMDALGLSIFDAQGKFVGLRVFTDQLAKAKGRLTDQAFAAAASTAFGNEGLTAANALAAEGAKGFDEMAKAVSKEGGAAEVAAAKTKGLGGAMEGLRSQIETAEIGIFEAIDGPLERLTRSGASFVEKFTPGVVRGIETAVAVGETFGPKLVAAIQGKLGQLRDVGSSLLSPLAEGIRDAVNSGVNLGTTAIRGFTQVVKDGVTAVTPFVRGVGDLAASFDKAGGPVGALRVGLELTYSVASGIIKVIAPIAGVVGGLASAFGELPGPIQTAAVALLALKFGPTILGSLTGALRGAKTEAEGAARSTGFFGRGLSTVLAPVKLVAGGLAGAVSVVRQFNDEARVQAALSKGTADEVGRLGGAMAAFNTSTIPAVAAAHGFTDQAGQIRRGAEGANAPIGRLAAAFGVLAERSPAIAAMAASFTRTSTSVNEFGQRAGLAAGIATESFGQAIPRAIGATVSAIAKLPVQTSNGLMSMVTSVRSAATAVADFGTKALQLPAGAGTGFDAARDVVVSRSQSMVQAVQAIPTAIGVAGIKAIDGARTMGTGIGVAFINAADKVKLLPTAIGSGLITALNKIPVAVQGSVTALGTLASKAAGVATSIGTGLTRAIGGPNGLIAALGGPWGLALAGAGAALGILASNQAKAASAAAKHKAGVDGLAVTLRETGGVINDVVRNQIANTLVTEFGKGAEAAEKFGVNLNDVVEMSLNGGDALKQLADRLGAIAAADPLSQQGQDAFALLVTIGQLNKRYGDAVTENRRLAEATGDTDTATSGLSAAVKTLASSTSSVEEKASALRDTLKLLTGGAQSARDAQASFYAAIDGLAERLQNANGRILDNAGALDVTTQKGREVNGVLKDAQQAFTDFAASQASAGKSSSEIAAGLTVMRGELVKVLTPLVGGEEAAKALVDTFKLMPTDIAIAVTSPGLLNAKNAAELLVGKLKAIPDDKTIVVDMLTDEAIAQLKTLGFTIEKVNGEIKITAKDDIAIKQLQNVIAIINGATGTTTIKGDPKPAFDEHGKLLQFIDRSSATTTTNNNLAPSYNSLGQFLGFVDRSYATTTGKANFRPAYDEHGAVVGYINSHGALMPMDVATGGAQRTVDNFIASNSRKTITIGVTAAQNAAGVWRPGPQIGSAKGNLLQAFAGGGVAGRSLTPMRGGLATIVPPNTWRVVGDRLRDDEAYIPINRSSRSVALLDETAKRMGFALARMYAHGGVATSGTGSMPTLNRGRAAGVVVENLNLRALSDRFSLQQVTDELYYAGVH